MSDKYKFHHPDGVYFVTSTITEWIDIFTRSDYCNVVLDSLKYCQKNKGLVIHAWCIMPNHIHMIISRNRKSTLSEIMRDFKRYTSIEIVKTIENTNESRKKWIINIFKETAGKIKRVENYKVWHDGNHPVELDSNYLIEQKLEYIHENPVKAGFVWEAEHYVYSSATDYAGGKGLLDVELLL